MPSQIKLADIPPPAEKRLALRVTPAAERQLRAGHPWLFDGSITSQSRKGKPGDLAVIFDRKRRFLAIGFYDPHSPIRVKVLQHSRPTPIDTSFFTARLRAAAERRRGLPEQGTTGYRLVYGEGDRLPGLVIDRYADTLVLKLYSTGWLPHLPAILHGLEEVADRQRWILRFSRAVARTERWLYGLKDGHVLRGSAPDRPVQFRENELILAADVIHGQKTGFFFDQRDNRERVRRLARGRTVLDVFAYTGGFALNAAAGGATHVTSLDSSGPALAMARTHFSLNKNRPEVATARHETIEGDAFQELARLGEAGRRFDLVIVDPPSFAKRSEEIYAALAAYDRITRLALGVLARQGILVMASCSSRIKPPSFFDAVEGAAAAAGRPLRVLARSGHPRDHPIRPEFPEGEYLKCLYATADVA